MKHTKCKICGKEHALGGCPEFQSTAARKDVPRPPETRISADETRNGWRVKPVATLTRPPESAGTQALPVDTHPKPKIGRPRTGFNKKEYNRQFTADLRTIKRLGLNCTVKEWREKNGNLQN